MYCVRCGNELLSGDKKCSKCGRILTATKFAPSFELFANLTIFILFEVIFFAGGLFKIGSETFDYVPSVFNIAMNGNVTVAILFIIAEVALIALLCSSAIEKYKFKQTIGIGLSALITGLVLAIVVVSFCAIENAGLPVSPSMYCLLLIGAVICMIGVNSKHA